MPLVMLNRSGFKLIQGNELRYRNAGEQPVNLVPAGVPAGTETGAGANLQIERWSFAWMS
jgi:hypothetical protein